MADVTMPQLGETVTEGTITKWFKEVGDKIEADEVLFEVSTDKVDSEVPSPSSGYLAEIVVPEGDTVEVGETLAIISDNPPDGSGGGSDESADTSSDDASSDDDTTVDETPAPESATPDPEPESNATPESAPEPAKAEAPASSGDGMLLSPVVRRLINENDLDPSTISGTGAGGRITRNDVLSAIDAGAGASSAGTTAKAPAARPAAAPRAETPSGPAPRPGERDVVEPLNNIRRRTGEHMVMSKSHSPHALSVMEVDYENVERVRRAERPNFKAEEGFSLTYLPFIARAAIDALREFPHLNATVGEGELIVHNYVNLAIAVDLDYQGLVAPVIKDADTKRMRAIAREVSDLAGKARSKRLGPDDITGGTFTITNPGPYGSLISAPIINQPQVAILSTEGVSRKPVVVEMPDGSEGIAIHSVGMLAMSWDHRAFDGAYATAYLAKVREILEERDWNAEL